MTCHQYLRSEMQKRGYRMTRQRQKILDAVHRFHQPATAAKILGIVRVDDPQTDDTTVYRTLNFLESFGLISAYDTTNGVRRYQHAGYDGRPHLACRQCGKTIEINRPDLRKMIARIGKANGFDVHLASVVIPGVCRVCRKK
jgi:Fur family ferric uptake transcriptional regulator